MSDALSLLGFPIAHASEIFHAVSGNTYNEARMGTIVDDLPFRAELFDALCVGIDQSNGIQDSPAVFFYKELAEKYTDAKFVFTTRDRAKWIASLVGFVADKSNPLRRYMYGVPRITGHEDVFLETFARYHNDIRAFFKDSPNFREFDISKGELTWENLLEFLGKDFYPDVDHAGALTQEFPRSNVNIKT